MDMRRFGLSDDDLRQLGYRVGDEGRAGEAPEIGDRGGPSVEPVRKRTSSALRMWTAMVVLLSIVGWASGLQRRLPDPVAVTGPDDSFSSARALAQLVEVAQRPHPTGSPDLIRVRSVLRGRMTALGLSPEIQVTTARARDASSVRAATVRNVLVRLPGSASTGAVALVAHYDTAPLSPGAGDNAVGVALALESLRAVQAGGALRNDLIVVLTDGDEVGLLGSKAFTEEHPWAQDVAVTVTLESRGTSGPVVLSEGLEGNGAFIETLADAGAGRAGSSLAAALRFRALESMEAVGLPGYQAPELSVTLLGGRAWEDQSRDVRERVDEPALQRAGDETVALVRALGGLDLRRDVDSPTRMSLSLPTLGLVHYPGAWNLLVTLGLVALWTVVGLVIRLRRGTRNGVLAGLGVGAGAAGLSALAASSLLSLLGDLHPEYGMLETALYRDGPHVLALAGIVLAVTSTLYGAARRWCRRDEVLFGGLAVPLGFAVWVTLTTPSAAPAVQWPLAIGLVGAGLVTVLGPRRGSSVWTWAVVLVLSSATLTLVAPALELVAAVWTLRSATALGALLGLATLVFLPLMDWLQRPRAWMTPLLGLGAAATFVAVYLPGVQGAADHPQPTTLVYLTDEVAPTDPILRGPGAEADTASARTVLGEWLTVPGPGEEWARSWVGEPPTGSTEPGVLLIDSDDRYQVAGTAPDAELRPPSVTVVSSTRSGARRDVVLEVRSGLGGEILGFSLPDGASAELTGVGDESWPVSGIPVRRLVHWGVPDGTGLRLGLSLEPDASTAELLVLEHHLRPREVLGDYFFQRADSIIPNAATGSDRVIQRTRVTVQVPSGPLPVGGQQPPGGEEPLESAEQPVGQ